MQIVFIGGGTMAEAMVAGTLDMGLYKPRDILVSEPISDRRNYLKEKYDLAVFDDSLTAINKPGSDIIILAIKPKDVPTVFDTLLGNLKKHQVIVSIVAGVKIPTISKGLNHKKIVRVMPNMPAQIGAGISVWSATNEVTAKESQSIRSILATLGEELHTKEEKYIDMATAISGSGPAYTFVFIESLIEAGVYLGMTREMSSKLVLSTISGSTLLAQKTGRHPTELKDMIASPGGTTVEGLRELESNGFREAIAKAVTAAYKKSLDLGKG